MIQTEDHGQARVYCDGCREITMLYPDVETAVFELPLIGWRDIGGGNHIRGIPFRHLCAECLAKWNHDPLPEKASL